MVKQRILVISSCGKKKSISTADQPVWEDLNTEDKRNLQIKRLSSSLVPAAKLYVGPQSIAINKAVKILKSIVIVDYYIISAGFGLIHEDTLLPPYESTFSNKRVSEIKTMSETLNIQQKIEELPNSYDLIYLALGKDYLKTINDLGVLKDKSKEIIYFQNLNEYSTSPFSPIDISNLIGNDKIPLISYRIGRYTESKGSLLVNYANYILKNQEFTSFKSFWNQVLNQLHNSVNMRIKSNNHLYNNPTIKTEIPYSLRGQDYLVNQETKSKIAKRIKKFTYDDLFVLSKNCQGLIPFSAKKWDSHKEFHKHYIDRIPFFRGFQESVNRDVEEICEETGETLGKTRIEYLDQIKQKQYLAEIFEYTINAPKFAVMKTLIGIDDDPSSIDRLTKRRENNEKKKTKKPTVVVEELTVQLNEYGEEDELYIFTFDLINNVNYPLQNIEIKLFNNNNRELNVVEIVGGFHPIQTRNGFNLPFLKASMVDTKHVETISVRTQTIPKITDIVKMNCQLDLPVDQDKMELYWEFNL